MTFLRSEAYSAERQITTVFLLFLFQKNFAMYLTRLVPMNQIIDGLFVFSRGIRYGNLFRIKHKTQTTFLEIRSRYFNVYLFTRISKQ